MRLPEPEELAQLEPLEDEDALGYEVLRTPYSMSPRLYAARLIAHYREQLLVGFEALALELEPDAQAKLRVQIARARGRL